MIARRSLVWALIAASVAVPAAAEPASPRRPARRGIHAEKNQDLQPDAVVRRPAAQRSVTPPGRAAGNDAARRGAGGTAGQGARTRRRGGGESR